MQVGTQQIYEIFVRPQKEVAGILRGSNLRRYGSWIRVCKDLLADLPVNVALTDPQESGYIMLFRGELIGIPAPTPGLLPSLSDSVVLEGKAWDFYNDCWFGLTQFESDSLLRRPVFKCLQLTK